MAGNVREWTKSPHTDYPLGDAKPKSSDFINRGDSFLKKEAVWGGSFTRTNDSPGRPEPDIGVRCAADAK